MQTISPDKSEVLRRPSPPFDVKVKLENGNSGSTCAKIVGPGGGPRCDAKHTKHVCVLPSAVEVLTKCRRSMTAGLFVVITS